MYEIRDKLSQERVKNPVLYALELIEKKGVSGIFLIGTNLPNHSSHVISPLLPVSRFWKGGRALPFFFLARNRTVKVAHVNFELKFFSVPYRNLHYRWFDGGRVCLGYCTLALIT